MARVSRQAEYVVWLVTASIGSAALAPTAQAWSRDVIGLFRGTLAVEQVGTSDAWLARLLGSLLWLVCTAVSLGLFAALGGRLPGVLGRVARRVSLFLLPRTLARVAAGACGFAVALAPIAAQAATPGPAPTPSITAIAPPSSAVPAPSPTSGLPDWPTDPTGPAGTSSPSTMPAPSPAERSAPEAEATPNAPSAAAPAATTTSVDTVATTPDASSSGVVTVRPGDSLWLIAARRLGPAPTPHQIAAEWPALYRANSAAIGADPDLIRPGEVLTLPASSSN